MTFGSLFSGIGGIDLGLERAGMECKWQVEIDPFCRKVLAKHWPDVRRYEDVRTVGADNLEPVDVIAGGFPCQDVSVAGKREGLKEGNRSGLWFEYHRIICELRPRYVLVENVPGLLANGMDRVLGDLAEIGYDAEWQVLSAADMGAPHLRRRVFIVAYPSTGQRVYAEEQIQAGGYAADNGGNDVAYTHTGRFERCGTKSAHSDTRKGYKTKAWWTVEPDVGRVANGVPARVDRLKSLGNAVVPQCAEYIGRMIIDHANQAREQALVP